MKRANAPRALPLAAGANCSVCVGRHFHRYFARILPFYSFDAYTGRNNNEVPLSEPVGLARCCLEIPYFSLQNGLVLCDVFVPMRQTVISRLVKTHDPFESRVPEKRVRVRPLQVARKEHVL